MPEVAGIRFRNCGKIYDFEVNDLDLNAGDLVVVESEFGLSIGTVVVGVHTVEESGKELKKILHRASEEEMMQKRENESFQREAGEFCQERIMARGIPMKLVCTEATLDRKRIVFYFTADGRIDFRELVKDLASKFKTRIEMRQIGVRDKAKLVGGLGLCGKELCCRLFLTTFEPISIKMAKQQELVLNTGKLSGVCGRLMCCLGYEYDDIVSDTASAPAPQETPARMEVEVLDVPEGEPPSPIGEVVCCAVTSAGGSSDANVQPAKPAERESQPQTKRHKRKRRRRRKGRFHKKNGQ